ncbi:MAG: hypothetical protein J2P21_00355 [Chloracidobacterium sp.]|nr:hypothetical protein [Chloracidobacterium sp.]
MKNKNQEETEKYERKVSIKNLPVFFAPLFLRGLYIYTNVAWPGLEVSRVTGHCLQAHAHLSE